MFSLEEISLMTPSHPLTFHFRPSALPATLIALADLIRHFPQQVSLIFDAKGLIQRVELHQIPGPFTLHRWDITDTWSDTTIAMPGDTINLTITLEVLYGPDGIPVTDAYAMSQTLAKSCIQ
jgi:hypothetical protein